jgi:hypothetical protein
MAARPEQSMVTAQVIERSFFRKWCFMGELLSGYGYIVSYLVGFVYGVLVIF